MRAKFTLPWRGLIPQIFVLIILPLTILLLVFTFGSTSLHLQAMRSMVGERDERAVRSAAGALDAELNHRLAIIQTLALLPASTPPDALAEITARSDHLRSGFDYGIAFFTLGGEILATAGDLELWQGIAAGTLLPFETLLPASPADTLISPMFVVPGSGEKAIFIASRSNAANGSPADQVVTIGAFSPEALARSTLAVAFPAPGATSVTVIGRAGELLYQNGPADIAGFMSDHPGIQTALAGKSGSTYTRSGSSEHVVAFSPVSAAGWALLIEESWDKVADPTLQVTQVAPLVLVPFLLVFLAALWFGARQVIQPLQALEARAASVARGDYQEIVKPVGGIAEIRHLQAELIHLTHKVQAAQQSLHNYIGSITAGQEEERRRLARELHDDTIQSLIVLKQRIQLAQMAAQNQPLGGLLVELERLAEQTISDLRRLTRALRPIYLEDLGLVAALEMLAQEADQAGNCRISFQCQGVERRLSANVELALYRIAQEALRNIARHAHAAQAYLSISYSPDRVILNITDNGQGFLAPNSPAEFASAGHFGLLGVHERAELIGAKLQLFSSPGKGTRLTIQLF